MTIRGIVFDVDGTLADTEEAHRAAFNKTFAEAGLAWRWDAELYGKLLTVAGSKERLKFFLGEYAKDFSPPADLDGFVRQLYDAKTQHYGAMVRTGQIPLRPGIKTLIEGAHRAGLKLAVATTTAPENVAALLEVWLGADWSRMFGAIGAGDMVPHKKPAPDVYLWVLDKLGLAAAECIVLEDSEVGLRASLAAGLRTFVTPSHYTRGQRFDGAAAVLEDLSDLPAFYRLSGLQLA
jgi:beta-phosphoglucomutase-like phosphatase (HAD superfamily)